MASETRDVDAAEARRHGWWWRHGWWRLLVGLVVVVALPVGAYVLGRRAETPAESIARAAPPAAMPITVEVEFRVLEAAQVFRGRVEVETEQVGVVVEGTGLVTAAPLSSGDVIEEGTVLFEVDDRPVVVLVGQLPMVRSILPGSEGSVVVELQESLSRLGLYEEEVDGVYGPGTQDAVAALFEGLGYDPPPAVGVDEFRSAEEAVSAAEVAVAAANDALASARGGGLPTGALTAELRRSESALDLARESLAEAESAMGIPVPVGEVLTLPDLPVRVISARARVGMVVEGEASLVDVAAGEPMVVLGLRDQDRAYFFDGAEALFRSDDGEAQGTGIVAEVVASADWHDPDAVTGEWVALLEPTDSRGELASGFSLQVVMGASDSDEAGLVVPVTAVRSEGSGDLYVLVMEGDGETRRVGVEVSLESGGFVMVEPHGDLDEGDKVVVSS